MSRKLYRRKMWGGFSENKLDHALPREIDAGTDFGPAAIYRTRAEAKRHYEDVRRVEIREVKS